MHIEPRFTAQNALDIMLENKAPLDFNTGMPVYRAAIKWIAKTSIPGLITSDLSLVPMDLAFVARLSEHLNKLPPKTGKDRKKQRDRLTRLGMIARRLHEVPVVQSSPAWTEFLAKVGEEMTARGLNEQLLIPVASTLRQAAVQAGIDPTQVTAEWLHSLVQTVSQKRRRNLRRAAKLLDTLWEDLPPHNRPHQPFGPITFNSGRRKSYPLPVRVTEQLEAYIAHRVQGTMMPGLIGHVQIAEGIKSEQSTNVYRQGLGWMFDSLCHAGVLIPSENMQISDLARLDWLSMVAVEALAHYDADAGAPHIFPWKPIQPKTIYNRVNSLILMFGSLAPEFNGQSVDVSDLETQHPTAVDPRGLSKLLRAQFDNEMTAAHRDFCRRIVAEETRQRLLLNMHMICWAEAQIRWKTYSTQGSHERSETINLCALAAALALVVNIPFRARTVTEMQIGGSTPDMSLPPGQKGIEFHVSPKRMKAQKRFDAVLEDSKESCSRKIIDWFISGPRQELLHNRELLRKPRADRLLCGIGAARYNRVLTEWTESIGMRMTTHLFRHGIASVLINCCETTMEDVAGLLGNTVATVEQNYAFHDRILLRSKTLQKLEQHRHNLTEAQHPGRRRKS